TRELRLSDRKFVRRGEKGRDFFGFAPIEKGLPRARANYASRTTSAAALSSRKPRKTGARNFWSRVHSANLISATNTGLIQCIFFIIDGVMFCDHCPAVLCGRSTNGQSSRRSA